MFIYTLKASTIKFFGVVLLSVAVLVALVTVIPTNGSSGEVAAAAVDFDDVGTNVGRLDFLEQFGYDVNPEPLEIKEIMVPDEFDTVYDAYNDIQKAQGLNLMKYQGRKVTRYTYEAENYDFEGRVMANMLVYKGKVIAGDICSLDGEGFVHGFEKP